MNETLTIYRDDGPFAAAHFRVRSGLPIPAVVLALAALLVVLVPLAIEGDEAGDGLAGAAIIAAVLLGALSQVGRAGGGFDWLVPPALRLTEYAGLLWLGSVAGGNGLPAAFALVCALAFRHYDLVYRLRHRGVTPPAWVDNAGLGWEGRLLLGVLLLQFGVLPEGFFILAVVFAAVFVGESVAGWTGTVRSQQTAVYEEAEDEGQ